MPATAPFGILGPSRGVENWKRVPLSDLQGSLKGSFKESMRSGSLKGNSLRGFLRSIDLEGGTMHISGAFGVAGKLYSGLKPYTLPIFAVFLALCAIIGRPR